MGPVSKLWAVRKPWEAAVPVARANRQRAELVGASESLDDVPHRPRLPSYPADRPRDLYGSLSALLGIRRLSEFALAPVDHGADQVFAMHQAGQQHADEVQDHEDHHEVRQDFVYLLPDTSPTAFGRRPLD